MSARIASIDRPTRVRRRPPKERRLDGGTSVLIGPKDLLAHAESALVEAHARRRDAGAFGELPRVGDAYIKGGPLRGRSSIRHALRVRLLDAELPRMKEFGNLEWLRRAGFHAPLPLFAGVWWRHGRPRAQVLATQRIDGAGSLRGVLEDAHRTERRERLLDSLSAEVARLHAAGFAHGDLYPRNLLYDEGAASPRIFFLDAWRGGRIDRGKSERLERAAARDLGCFFLHGALWLDEPEQVAFLERYVSARARGGARVDVALLLRHLAVRRRREFARFSKRADRRRDLPPPPERWTPPAIRARPEIR